jgi:hypothetical protein
VTHADRIDISIWERRMWDMLSRLREERSLVDLRRDRFDSADLRGYVLDLDPELALIALVADDVTPNGYSLVMTKDISFVRWGMRSQSAWQQALAGSSWFPAPKDLSLSGWPQAINSLKGAGVLSVYREGIDSATAYLGMDFLVNDDALQFSQVTIEGEENGLVALNIEDISRIDFGGSYEGALLNVLRSRSRKRG